MDGASATTAGPALGRDGGLGRHSLRRLGRWSGHRLRCRCRHRLGWRWLDWRGLGVRRLGNRRRRRVGQFRNGLIDQRGGRGDRLSQRPGGLFGCNARRRPRGESLGSGHRGLDGGGCAGDRREMVRPRGRHFRIGEMRHAAAAPDRAALRRRNQPVDEGLCRALIVVRHEQPRELAGVEMRFDLVALRHHVLECALVVRRLTDQFGDQFMRFGAAQLFGQRERHVLGHHQAAARFEVGLHALDVDRRGPRRCRPRRAASPTRPAPERGR